MTIHYLRCENLQTLTTALIAANVAHLEDNSGTVELVANEGYTIDMIGRVYKPTGAITVTQIDDENVEVPVMELTEGYHANLMGELTYEQITALPIIPAPDNPVRAFWG